MTIVDRPEQAEPTATVVVVPRERFSAAQRSIESVLEHTTCPHSLVYVDGGSPSRLGRYLDTVAAARGFHLIRAARYLTPNQARNIGWRAATTPYVAFVDNDVVVSPGWLEALVECAEETGAWLVSPTICIGEPLGLDIHMAGGTAAIRMENGRRILREQHRYADTSLKDVGHAMRREATELIEFHAVLVRRDVFDRLGALDERLLSTREHVDLSLAVQEAGGTIFFEPASVVTYLAPPPFDWSDYPYFLLRWSEAWNLASLRHFRAKWQLGDDDPQLTNQALWIREHRHLVFKPFQTVLSRIAGTRLASAVVRRIVAPLEVVANRLACHEASRTLDFGRSQSELGKIVKSRTADSRNANTDLGP